MKDKATEAFETAIKMGYMTDDSAGEWMFMGNYDPRGAAFKSITTREYIYLDLNVRDKVEDKLINNAISLLLK